MRVVRLGAPADVIEDTVLQNRAQKHGYVGNVTPVVAGRVSGGPLLRCPAHRLEEYESGRRMVWHTSGRSVESTEEFDLRPEAAYVTVVRVTLRWHLIGPLRLVQPLLRLPALVWVSVSARHLRRTVRGVLPQ